GAAVRSQGRNERQGSNRLLPHRRAVISHLVRAEASAELSERPKLRRILDRVWLPDRRSDREVTRKQIVGLRMSDYMRLITTRALASANPALLQIGFEAAALDRYRESNAYHVMRTNT